jgi:hypothetical protein
VDAERLKNTANEHVQAGRLEEGQRLYSQALSRLETAPNTSEVYTRLWTAVKLNTARVHMMREHWVAAAECCDQVIADKRSMAAPPSRHKAYYRRVAAGAGGARDPARAVRQALVVCAVLTRSRGLPVWAVGRG